jgi:hypothetical protein
VDVEFVVEQARQLADCHTVPQRDGELADKRRERRIQPAAFDLVAANRIRPIADDHVDAVPGRCAHAVGHGVDVGVDPGADILQIHHQHVEIAQHVGHRLPRVAVKRVHRHVTPRILCVRRFNHVVLKIGAEPVLRAEERGDLDVWIADEPISRVTEQAVY